MQASSRLTLTASGRQGAGKTRFLLYFQAHLKSIGVASTLDLDRETLSFNSAHWAKEEEQGAAA